MTKEQRNKEVLILIAMGFSSSLAGKMYNIARNTANELKKKNEDYYNMLITSYSVTELMELYRNVKQK